MEFSKIISKKNFVLLRQKFEEKKKTVVLCHGVYDLLHYGHIEHLKEAKKQGDILVVSVTASLYVNKGPGRPYFKDEQRMLFLASLECVDYVILSETVTVSDVIAFVKPDIYVKGQEYANEDNDITGNIVAERKMVEAYGGKIYFTQGVVFSSTKLLNNFFDVLPKDVVKEIYELRKKYGEKIFEVLKDYIEKFCNLKVLIVGEVIFDEYTFCSLQGLTSKDGTLSVRKDYKERYLGGAIAIAKHIANFSDNVTFCSLIGTEDNLYEYLKENVSDINLEIIRDEKFKTPIKERFLKRHPQREEYDKLFSVNHLFTQNEIKNYANVDFYNKLEQFIEEFDIIVLCDYGHGLIDERIMQLTQKKARFLAVNCQTNSANYGMNIITKYNRADVLVVDEKELNLAFGQNNESYEQLLQKLSVKLNSYCSWVTLGAKGALGRKKEEQALIPALTLHVKDTIGAGDAFYALATLCSFLNMPIDLATLVSNAAGALKTSYVGNSSSIKKVDLLKFLNTVLNV